MCPLARSLQEWHRVGESSCQKPPQAWKCSSEPWPAGLSCNRPREESPRPACTRNFASCTGPRPQAMQNTIQDTAPASKSLIHTRILRMNGFMRNGSILMKMSLAIRGTTTDLPSSVQRPDRLTFLGHRGRAPGHRGHPGTDRHVEESRIPESRILSTITTTTTLPPTTGSTNPGSRMPRERKLPFERTSPTPTTTMTTMKPIEIYLMPGPTTGLCVRHAELVHPTAQLRYCAETRIAVASIQYATIQP